MAMNLFGHGIALSGDFIIQGAPKLTADGAGIPVSDVISASIPLVIIMGVVTTIAAFLFLRNDMKKGTISTESRFELPGTKDAQIGSKNTDHIDLPKKAKVFFCSLNTCALYSRSGNNVGAQTARGRRHRSYWRHIPYNPRITIHGCLQRQRA